MSEWALKRSCPVCGTSGYGGRIDGYCENHLPNAPRGSESDNDGLYKRRCTCNQAWCDECNADERDALRAERDKYKALAGDLAEFLQAETRYRVAYGSTKLLLTRAREEGLL